ncbi:G-protein coupled receptor 84 [Ctenocephalides felis]|uniref:G-protein coupled receptor 84 n=1 Tax=Ctenocephalides felis TaxID=7515 RepID=UPI000E6E1EE0|nr:G-protein coupled receptor 84 [Ctenocephalides felis]
MVDLLPSLGEKWDNVPNGSLFDQNRPAVAPTIFFGDLKSENLTLSEITLFEGYPDWLLELAACSCLLFALIGIPGNLITIAALARCKKVRNATAVFIMNLSLSDLLFCCFNLPLAASTFRERAWHHGTAMCVLFPLLRYGLLAVSLLSVLAITVNRYVMIGHPRSYPRLYRNRNLALMWGGTWVFGFGALLPTLFGIWGHFGLDAHVGSCSILPGEDGRSPKEFLFVTAFVVPCISIIVCYARIFCIVRRAAMRAQQQGDSGLGGEAAVDRSSAYESDAGEHNPSAIYPATPDNGVGQMGFQNEETHNHHFGGYELVAPQETYENVKIEDGGNKISYSLQQNGYGGYDMQRDGGAPIGAISKMSTVSLPDPHLLSPIADSNIYNHNHNQREQESSSGIESSVDQDEMNDQNNEEPPAPPKIANQNIRKFQSQKSYGSPRSERSFASVPAVLRKSKRYLRPNAPERRSIITTSTSSLRHPGKMSAKDKKLLRMILVIFLSFLICYLPITITKIFKMASNYQVLNISGYLLIYLTTCMNPIIYVVMSSEYRQAYKNLLMCRGCFKEKLQRGATTRRTIKA